MDHFEREEKKREAMRKLGAQRRRAGELRRRVVATSLVAFVLLWAVVFAQMATGNDPVLSAKSAAAVATTSGSHRKARAARKATGAVEAEPAEAEREVSAAEAEAEVLEAEAERFEAEAEAESEAFEAEAETEAVEAEPEVEEFIEEPAPVTTSQS